MSVASAILSTALIILGSALVLVGGGMNSYIEEDWKEKPWWREMIYGPPGFYRASVIILGGTLILIGIIRLVYVSLSFS